MVDSEERTPSQEEIKPSDQLPLDEETVDADVLRTLTRLLVGSTEMSVDQIVHALRSWEQAVAEGEDLTETRTVEVLTVDVVETDDGEVMPVIPEAETDADLIRYAMIGMLFETQKRMRSSANMVGKFGRAVERASRPWLRPLRKSRLFSPMQRRYDSLVKRGEKEVNRWVALGRVESAQSQRVAATALTHTVDQSIEYLADAPQVKELVASQGTSMATEMMDDVRGRTVNADNFVEGLIRALLRLTPRSELPGPPPEVRDDAIGFKEARERRMSEE
jgi:hypothetical protein